MLLKQVFHTQENMALVLIKGVGGTITNHMAQPPIPMKSISCLIHLLLTKMHRLTQMPKILIH